MPTDFEAAALSAVRRARGVDVAIVRAASEAGTTAIVGKTVFTDKSDGQAARSVQRIETRDYLLPAADYLVDGAAAKPAAGDQIQENGRTYEAVSVFGEPCYRYATTSQTWLRVHTTLVDY
jgi:hypothetical protein